MIIDEYGAFPGKMNIQASGKDIDTGNIIGSEVKEDSNLETIISKNNTFTRDLYNPEVWAMK